MPAWKTFYAKRSPGSLSVCIRGILVKPNLTVSEFKQRCSTLSILQHKHSIYAKPHSLGVHNAAWISPSSRGPMHTSLCSLLHLPIAAKENQYVNTHRKCWVLTLQGNVCLSLQFCSVRKRKKNCSLTLPRTLGDEKHQRHGCTVLFSSLKHDRDTN